MADLARSTQCQRTGDGRVDPSRLATLLAPWEGRGPAYQSVASGLRALALDGRLAVGERVPSERDLAGALGVGRGTVTAAFDVLRTEGYLTSDRGGGSRIALPAAHPQRPDTPFGGGEQALDLTVAALPAPAQVLPAVERATVALRPWLAGHGLHPFGLPELREQVAVHLTARGLSTRAEQVLVTGGALHGWDLVLAALARTGDRVVVEQPTYPAVLDAVAARGLRAVPLPVTVRGWELAGRQGVLAHVTPDAQNPTGLVATTAQRRLLLAGLVGARVVADETFADLVLEGPLPRPLGALRSDVVSLGSMSKAFWAGLRVGWVRAAPEVLVRLAQQRGASDLAGPVLDQLVALELLKVAQEVLTERREHLRRCRDALLEELGRVLPDWGCEVPRAGMVLWVELPETGATRLAAHALDLGLRVTAGPRFTVDGTADRFLRLPFTQPPERVREVVRLLAAAAVLTRSPAAPRRSPLQWTA